MRKISVAVIIVLLASIVGYLALDRHDKEVEREQERAFKLKFFK
jgi:hypothetical protein